MLEPDQGPNLASEKEPAQEGPKEGEWWGGVTDPNEHNPKRFQYLVYAFNPFARSSKLSFVISDELSGPYQTNQSEGDQSIDLFAEPERLAERVSLSMSLIDENHTGTWGPGGLIIGAPIPNIIITSPTDVGAHNSSEEHLRRQAHNRTLLSPDQLLQSTPPTSYSYNEVVALARTESGEQLQLLGFFIKVDKNGRPIDPIVAEKMKEHSERLGLPLVEIQFQGLYEQEMFEIKENDIWANYKGNRYNLGSDDPSSAFFAYDYKASTFFPSPQEIEEVIAHFVRLGYIDEAQAQQIRERYGVADSQRKSPKIEYDPESKKISRVTIKDGYGEDEIEYRLNLPSGYCWKVDLEEYNKASREVLLNPQRVVTNSYEYLRYQTPLSGSKVLRILESIKETMDPEEYKKLFFIFSEVKEIIDQRYDQSLPPHYYSSINLGRIPTFFKKNPDADF